MQAWQSSKPYNDPGMEEMFGRRFRWTRDSLQHHVRQLRTAARQLAAGKDSDLNACFGGNPTLVLRAGNPSADLIDLLKVDIHFSGDGKRWERVSHKNWFLLESQTYITATVPPADGGRTASVPRYVRLPITRTHIDPKNYPLADRFEVLAARTLTPGEILDGPPPADLETIDWRLVYDRKVRYRLTRREPWLLEYALAAAE